MIRDVIVDRWEEAHGITRLPADLAERHLFMARRNLATVEAAAT